jgi:hypothetical protein
MKAGDWGSIVSAVAAAAALFYSLWSNRKSSQAALRAANAELRADEALALAKGMAERDRARFAGEEAELEAPHIADRWIGEIKQKWGEGSPSDHSVLTMPVATRAERRALEIVRSRQESLHIVGIQYVPAEHICRISAWNRAGYHRRFGKIPAPPGSVAG